MFDLDATIVTSTSRKEGAAATWKKTFGFHPLGAWCANAAECLAMLLRPGSAGSNTAGDHLTVLADALAQVPGSSAAKILIGVDGAGASRELHKYLRGLNTTRRTVRFTTGWKISPADEKVIACLPEAAWETSLNQDGSIQEDYFIAELTGLDTRTGWIKDKRLIVRRVRPSRRHLKDLTALEKKTGWKYSITATNITKMARVPRSHQAQWLDVLHRDHVVVKVRVRTNKAMGLRNLLSKSWAVNKGGILAANLAADLEAWLRPLALQDQAPWPMPSPRPHASGSCTSLPP